MARGNCVTTREVVFTPSPFAVLETIEFSSRLLSMSRVASESVPGRDTTTLAEVVPTVAA